MTYELAFLEIALKEWRKLDSAVRDEFKKKLSERLGHPRPLGEALRRGGSIKDQAAKARLSPRP
jgi:mRNA-degrading endonuclease RelE of RelBE toxin-antitoxin system